MIALCQFSFADIKKVYLDYPAIDEIFEKHL